MGLTIKTISQNRFLMDCSVLGIVKYAFIVSHSEVQWENILY